MTITYGFYNSIDGDRRYDAKDLSSLFDGIINDGVFMSIGEHLIVTPSNGMNVTVGTGRAWFNHSWTNNDSPIILPIDQAELILNRIDAVVLEINAGEEVRANSFKIIRGVPASTPAPPILEANDLVNQHPLATIYITAGVTQIIPANITNKIGTSQCPFITGILTTINSATLLAQWASQFSQTMTGWNNEFNAAMAFWGTLFYGDLDEWTHDFNSWFDTIQGILNGDLAGSLATSIINLDAKVENNMKNQQMMICMRGLM